MGQADGWRALVAGRLLHGGLRWGLAMADGGGLFGGLFGTGGVRTGDTAWLQAMLDTEAALARAAERAGPAARAVHAGATSQDILDTAAMLLARQSLTAILADLARAAAAAADLAREHD